MDPIPLGPARVILGDRLGEGAVFLVELFHRLIVGISGQIERGPSLGDFGILLGRVLRLVREDHGQVSALHHHPRDLDIGLARGGEIGVLLGETLQLRPRLIEEFLAPDEIPGPRGFLEQGLPFLVVEPGFEFGRQAGLTPQHIEFIDGEVEIAAFAKGVEELGGYTWILGGRDPVGSGEDEYGQGAAQSGTLSR